MRFSIMLIVQRYTQKMFRRRFYCTRTALSSLSLLDQQRAIRLSHSCAKNSSGVRFHGHKRIQLSFQRRKKCGYWQALSVHLTPRRDTCTEPSFLDSCKDSLLRFEGIVRQRAMERLRQNFNLAGVRVYLELLSGNRRLALPHLAVKRLGQINWKGLQTAGVKGCVFDKDNTLTRPFKNELEASVSESLEACRQTFGDALVLFSNSAGLAQYDPEYKEVADLEKALGIKVLRHREKKPAGGVQELEEFFGCKADRLAIIGDRLLTDIVYGNLNRMFTIYVDPLDVDTEPVGVKIGRITENRLWSDCKQKGLQGPDHEIIKTTESLVISEQK